MLITSAPQSKDDEFDRRRRKYAIMMASRALCVVGAGLTYQLSIWVALAFVAGGAVLPWCAVLIANDRPAKKRQAKVGYVGPIHEKALPPPVDKSRVFDA